MYSAIVQEPVWQEFRTNQNIIHNNEQRWMLLGCSPIGRVRAKRRIGQGCFGRVEDAISQGKKAEDDIQDAKDSTDDD